MSERICDRLHIAVIGAGTVDERLAEFAEETGRRIAEAGAVLVCGGLGGVMEYAARGAKSARGATIGILPGEDRHAANGYIDIAIATGLGHARNLAVLRSADAAIAIGGAGGTLSEIGFGLIGGRPLVLLAGWRIAHENPALELPPLARTPEEAVETILEMLRNNSPINTA